MQTTLTVQHAEYHGSDQVITVDPGIVKIDITALATVQSVYKVQLARYSALPTLYSAHPIFTGLFVEKVEYQTKGVWCVATCDYVGLLAAQYPNVQPTYEMTVGLAETPISTHPDFVSSIGGTPAAPLHGAIFESQGGDKPQGQLVYAGGTKLAAPPATNTGAYKFAGFRPVNADGSLNLKWGGVTSYLDPYVTWRETVVVASPQSDLYQVGTIVTNPPGPAPSLGGTRNWIYMGMSQTRRANVWQTVKEWRSSGRNGWNDQIYRSIS